MDTVTWILLAVVVAGVVWLLFFSEPAMTIIKEAGEYTLHGGLYRIDAASGTVALTLPAAKGGHKEVRVIRAVEGAEVTWALTGSDTFDGTTTPPATIAAIDAVNIVQYINDRKDGWYTVL